MVAVSGFLTRGGRFPATAEAIAEGAATAGRLGGGTGDEEASIVFASAICGGANIGSGAVAAALSGGGRCGGSGLLHSLKRFCCCKRVRVVVCRRLPSVSRDLNWRDRRTVRSASNTCNASPMPGCEKIEPITNWSSSSSSLSLARHHDIRPMPIAGPFAKILDALELPDCAPEPEGFVGIDNAA